MLDDIEPLMQAAFDEVRGTPAPGSGLDQVYLLDGREVVNDFLGASELGLAFDHLRYMTREPPLPIRRDTYDRIVTIGRRLGVSAAGWAAVAPTD
ncbi:MAG: hypothetical protein QNJ12_14235 [Ilumatobacter sp.]|uniref:hypothetical protein n=1 Tax=Ilumatobacter sp. TaxID=1967498 RepID=UPI00260FD153|nr:hypothetical protein [Ilumatobacter sp.]MDJ0769955.1 hypothetical protein [Ilumatobacter sp.]